MKSGGSFPVFLCVGVFNVLVDLWGTPFWVGRERVFLLFSHAFYFNSFRYTYWCIVINLWSYTAIPAMQLELPVLYSSFLLTIYFAHGSVYRRRRRWHPTPVLLPGESHGRRSLVGCSPWGHDWATSLSLFTFMHWRRKWQPTPVFAWRIPGREEPGGLPSLGSHRVGHDWSNLAAAVVAAAVRQVSNLLNRPVLILSTLNADSRSCSYKHDTSSGCLATCKQYLRF